VDVGLFMNELCRLQTSELEEIVLKNGNALIPIESGLMLPPKLSTLTVVGIAWEPGTLESFLSLCAYGNHGHRPLSLDISDASLPESGWPSVDRLLGVLPLDSLVSLAWDCNPIGEGFAAILGRNPSLAALSINCCPHVPEVIGPLSYFVQHSTLLTGLSLNGNRTANFRSGMEEIMIGIYHNDSLVALDVSGNRVGDNILVMVGSLVLNHPTLSRIALDGNDITSREDIAVLFDMMLDHPRRIQLQFPQADLEQQWTLGAITQKEIELLRDECLACLKPEVCETVEERPDEGSLVATVPLDIPSLFLGGNNAFLDTLLPEAIQSIVRSVGEAYVSDSLWERVSFVEPPVDTDDRLLAIKDRFEIGRLLEAIPD
jgi:hypothetical protein